jgi:hypothetical protein
MTAPAEVTKSQIMTVYNHARKAARLGKLDEKRLNRALGVLMSKTPRPYHTTIYSCDCPDHQRHPEITCKHMLAAAIVYRVQHPKAVAA